MKIIDRFWFCRGTCLTTFVGHVLISYLRTSFLLIKRHQMLVTVVVIVEQQSAGLRFSSSPCFNFTRVCGSSGSVLRKGPGRLLHPQRETPLFPRSSSVIGWYPSLLLIIANLSPSRCRLRPLPLLWAIEWLAERSEQRCGGRELGCCRKGLSSSTQSSGA